jgi:membrane protein
MWKRFLRYCSHDIWNVSLAELRGWHRRKVAVARVVVASFQGFHRNRSALWGSSLTYYSLMSLVPLLAMMFAFARGFGYQERLRAELLDRFKEQKTAVLELFNFADQLLGQTHEGVIAGIGLLVLFWSVTSLLISLEESLNEIWECNQLRSWRRILSDYFALMLVTPFLFLVSNSAVVFAVNFADQTLRKLPLAGSALGALSLILQLLPYLLFIFFFSFLYFFMPNTRVKAASSLIGGSVAGVFYVIAQWGYIHFQIGANRYGAIYGSFAALPLFLIWLQVSWFIFLFGAQVAHAHQGLRDREFAPQLGNVNARLRKALLLWIAQIAALRFHKKNGATTLDYLVQAHQIPIVLARPLVQELVACGILSELKTGAYIPARPVGQIRIADILSALDSKGKDLADLPFLHSADLSHFDKTLRIFATRIAQSDENQVLVEIPPAG